VFLGTYLPRLDDKSRLILPAKFRDELAGGLVITKGREHCLSVYTQETFLASAAELQARLRAAADGPDKARLRAQEREFSASASDEVPDRQGRITVPGELRRYAGIDRNVVVTGILDRLEIWDVDVYRRYQAKSEAAFAEDDDWIAPDPVDRAPAAVEEDQPDS
jgi:MraZ protein